MVTTSKREGELKALFAAELKRQAPDFLILRYATNGAPDRSVVGNGRQSNWEFKHATPDFRSPGDQELMCARLTKAGHCQYVIWMEEIGVEETLIVHPRDVLGRNGKGRGIVPQAWCNRFDMKWLVSQVLKEHS